MITNKEDLLVRHEGRVNRLYKDSLGYWTFGVGKLVDPSKGATIPWEVVDLQFSLDCEEVGRWIAKELPWVLDLDPVRHAVIFDMRFNLGPKLLDFKNTLKAVQEGRWDDAVDGMMASLWAKQVGPRASRLALMMRTGQWPTN